MALKRVSEIDCSRNSSMAMDIRTLREKIAHLETYTDTDVGLLKLQLEVMVEQERVSNKQT